MPWFHSKCYNVHNCQIPKLTSYHPISADKALFTSNVFSPCPLFTPLLLPPANEVWDKVMFLHLCVNLFTEGGGRRQTSGVLGRPPSPMQTPYGGQTPPDADPPLGWADPPRLQTLLDRTPRPHPNPGVGQTRPRYSQQAGGTHPTGMHTC